MKTKVCPSCRESLPVGAFGRNKTLPDGLSFYCLTCNRARNNRWYRENRRRLGAEVRDLSWVPDGSRWCPSCRQAVAEKDYSRNSGTASGFGSRCKACKSDADSAAYFYRRYRLTRNQVAQLRAAQGDRCAICGDESPQHLDHDHVSGRTREFLCQRCNNGLGLFRDDPRLLSAAADYVERHRARQPERAGSGSSAAPEAPGRPGGPPVGSNRRPGSARAARAGGRSSDRRRR